MPNPQKKTNISCKEYQLWREKTGLTVMSDLPPGEARVEDGPAAGTRGLGERGPGAVS